MFAHLDVPGSTPWVDEFFGHPHEYWPVYLWVGAVTGVLIYLYLLARDK